MLLSHQGNPSPSVPKKTFLWVLEGKHDENMIFFFLPSPTRNAVVFQDSQFLFRGGWQNFWHRQQQMGWVYHNRMIQREILCMAKGSLHVVLFILSWHYLKMWEISTKNHYHLTDVLIQFKVALKPWTACSTLFKLLLALPFGFKTMTADTGALVKLHHSFLNV